MKDRSFLALIISICALLILTAGCGGSGVSQNGGPDGTPMTLELTTGEVDGIYIGDTDKNGLPDGAGIFTVMSDDGNGWTYTGGFSAGHFEGEGEMEWEYGWKEVGIFHDDVIVPEPEGNVVSMYENPEAYANHCFILIGRIFNVVGFSDGILEFQMYDEAKNYDNNTYVIFNRELDLSSDDYVKVTGFVQGTYEYESVEDEMVRSVMFFADEVEVISDGGEEHEHEPHPWSIRVE